MAASISVWQRRLHRWCAILVALPLAVIIVTGILLQLKKHVGWIQPPEKKGAGHVPEVGFEKILQAARAVPEARVATWNDIDRLDIRPGKGIVKVQSKAGWEIQLDARTGEMLQAAVRRSDLIESLHDGSWFFSDAKLWVFLPAALILLGLWATGIYLWVLPYWVRWRRRRRRRPAASAGVR